MKSNGRNRLRNFERDIILTRKMDGETALLDEYNSNLATSSSASDVVPRQVTTEFNESGYPSCSSHYNNPMSHQNGNVIQQQPGGSRNEAAIVEMNDGDTDIEEELSHSCKQIIVPSKSQVLFYVSTCTHLRLNHQGSELQVTDPSDFPLLDIWSENVCDEAPIWIIESYGRRVAVVTDTAPRSLMSLIIPFLRPRRGVPTFSVMDWNGDVIGFYALGNDSIEVQDTRHDPIAKCYCEPDSNGEIWRIVCEKNPQRQLALLSPDGHLSFASDIALPLKLLLISTLSRAVVTRTTSSCFPFFR
ncbi:unnamed protein product [Caenorhabditis angaria]|uniref:Uncharacterized protein n=1 Tax=Caenorhabditis angaria TaxID=860376 RepID=A0A9P1ICB9_9PELO|nr:unnamed protein product [Caenorhabditis angaria]